MPRVILLLLALLMPIAAHAQDRTLTEADGTRTLVTEAWVPAAPGAVWQAVSTAEGWKSWAVPYAWMTGNLMETSYAAGAKQGDPANIQHRFTTLVPGNLLSFQTVRTPPGFPHAEAFMGVSQVFELIPAGAGTRVRLTGRNFPAGPEGIALLGFFSQGNRVTLDRLAARFGLAPLDFLAGHCWRGVLPNGDLNTHCFDRAEGTIRDRHEVFRGDRKVYGGNTVYRWDGETRTVRFTYVGMDGSTTDGSMRPDGKDLDFGSSNYPLGTGTVTIATRWIRVAPNAYEGRDTSATPKFNRTTRYTRVD